jgi:hypothetical protein
MRCAFLVGCLAAVAHGQCTTLATLPAPGRNLACYSGTVGGASASAPTLGPAPADDGDFFCGAYSIACSASDRSPACTGQPTGTVVRTFVLLGADTARQMLALPSLYMLPSMCATSGCNTVAASATCTIGSAPGGTITTLTGCGGSTCNVPASPEFGCMAYNDEPIPLDGTCDRVVGGFSLKAVPGTSANTATLTWYLTTDCTGDAAGTNANLPLAGSPAEGCQATFFGSVYAGGSSTGKSSAAASSVAWVALAAAVAAALALAGQ